MTFPLRTALAVSLSAGTLATSAGPAPPVAARAETATQAQCEAASPEAAKFPCYIKAAERANREVDRALMQNLRSAARLDAEFNRFARRHRIPGSTLARQLRSSQEAWTQYSRSECAFEGGSSFGGSGTDVLEAACHYRLGAARLAELDAAARLLSR
jgi:uncharacterized protein YecT (DUF1311 family)